MLMLGYGLYINVIAFIILLISGKVRVLIRLGILV